MQMPEASAEFIGFKNQESIKSFKLKVSSFFSGVFSFSQAIILLKNNFQNLPLL